MLKKVFSLLVWILIFQLVGYLLGEMTKTNVVTWYQYLHKPELVPPNIIFSIVWSIIYVMLAIAGWSLWQHRLQLRGQMAFLFFCLQTIMNWLWTPIFFYFHLIELSFWWLLSLIIISFITLLLTWNKFKLATAMLVPCWFWLFFAGYLNWSIWMMNSQ